MKPHAIDWSKWDDKLGTMPDKSLADQIGCTKLTVLLRRQSLDIASSQAEKFAARALLVRPTIYRVGNSGDWPIGIYVITCTATGERYVGSSRQLVWRTEGHAREMSLGKHSNPLLRDAVSKHGPESFTIEIVELCGYDELPVREAHWIDRLNPEFNRRMEKIHLKPRVIRKNRKSPKA